MSSDSEDERSIDNQPTNCEAQKDLNYLMENSTDRGGPDAPEPDKSAQNIENLDSQAGGERGEDLLLLQQQLPPASSAITVMAGAPRINTDHVIDGPTAQVKKLLQIEEKKLITKEHLTSIIPVSFSSLTSRRPRHRGNQFHENGDNEIAAGSSGSSMLDRHTSSGSNMLDRDTASGSSVLDHHTASGSSMLDHHTAPGKLTVRDEQCKPRVPVLKLRLCVEKRVHREEKNQKQGLPRKKRKKAATPPHNIPSPRSKRKIKKKEIYDPSDENTAIRCSTALLLSNRSDEENFEHHKTPYVAEKDLAVALSHGLGPDHYPSDSDNDEETRQVKRAQVESMRDVYRKKSLESGAGSSRPNISSPINKKKRNRIFAEKQNPTNLNRFHLSNRQLRTILRGARYKDDKKKEDWFLQEIHNLMYALNKIGYCDDMWKIIAKNYHFPGYNHARKQALRSKTKMLVSYGLVEEKEGKYIVPKKYAAKLQPKMKQQFPTYTTVTLDTPVQHPRLSREKSLSNNAPQKMTSKRENNDEQIVPRKLRKISTKEMKAESSRVKGLVSWLNSGRDEDPNEEATVPSDDEEKPIPTKAPQKKRTRGRPRKRGKFTKVKNTKKVAASPSNTIEVIDVDDEAAVSSRENEEIQVTEEEVIPVTSSPQPTLGDSPNNDDDDDDNDDEEEESKKESSAATDMLRKGKLRGRRTDIGNGTLSGRISTRSQVKNKDRQNSTAHHNGIITQANRQKIATIQEDEAKLKLTQRCINLQQLEISKDMKTIRRQGRAVICKGYGPVGPICYMCSSTGKKSRYGPVPSQISCSHCGEFYHSYCVEEQENVRKEANIIKSMNDATWRCQNCKFCTRCSMKVKEGPPGHKTGIGCKYCLQLYHKKCVSKESGYLTPMQRGTEEFSCEHCVRCERCGIRTPGILPKSKWRDHYTKCEFCHFIENSDVGCPHCDEKGIVGESEKWMQCSNENCNNWLHTKCEDISDEHHAFLLHNQNAPLNLHSLCGDCDGYNNHYRYWLDKVEEMKANGEMNPDADKKDVENYINEQIEAPFWMKKLETCFEKEIEKSIRHVRFIPEVKKIIEHHCKINKEFYNMEVMIRTYRIPMTLVGVHNRCKRLTELLPSDERDIVMDAHVEHFERNFPFFDFTTGEMISISPDDEVEPPVQHAIHGSDHTYCEMKGRTRAEEFHDCVKRNEIVESQEHDKRQCKLCKGYGDGDPSNEERLLPYWNDIWIHGNCCVWSAETYETSTDGCSYVMNVGQVMSRSRTLKCDLCDVTGASIGCYHCNANYHFQCARKAKFLFPHDRQTVYCNDHRYLAGTPEEIEKIEMKGDDFILNRRIMLDISDRSKTTAWYNDITSTNLSIHRGSLVIENVGKLSSLSDGENQIIPVGYRASRYYWSKENPNKKVLYTIEVDKVVRGIADTLLHDGKNTTICHDPSIKSLRTRPASPVKVVKKKEEIVDEEEKYVTLASSPPTLKNEMSVSHKEYLATRAKENGSSQQENFYENHARAFALHLQRNEPTQNRVQESTRGQEQNENRENRVQENTRDITESPTPANPLSHWVRNRYKILKDIGFDGFAKLIKPFRDMTLESIFDPSEIQRPSTTQRESWNEDRHELQFTITSSEGGLPIQSPHLNHALEQVAQSVSTCKLDTPIHPNVNYQSTFKTTIDPQRFLGFDCDPLIYVMEQLPGISKCTKYQPKYNQSRHVIPETESQRQQRKQKNNQLEGLGSRAIPIEGVKEMTRRNNSVKYFRHKKAPPKFEQLPTDFRKNGQNLEMAANMQYRAMKESLKKVGVYVSRIQGSGLFAQEPIRANEMICEYTGETIRKTLADVREKRYTERGIGCYMFNVNDYIIDATSKGNDARYINHSCDPNCTTKIIKTQDGEYHIVIRAKKDICKGEELTYDYQFPLEDESKKIECLCNSVGCRKYLNYDPKKKAPKTTTSTKPYLRYANIAEDESDMDE